MLCPKCGHETPTAYGTCEGCGYSSSAPEKGFAAYCPSCINKMTRVKVGETHVWFCDNARCHRNGVLVVYGMRSPLGVIERLAE